MTEWWRGGVIYQIYPRSFLDTTGNGVGDLPGIERRLDYVAELGVDAIWLSPFFPSPGKDHGYDVSDYCDIDPDLGTLRDFDRLVGRAHDLGLKIVIDQVYSHCSDQHAWFQESRMSRDNPRGEWFVWADPKPDGSPPNNWQSVFGQSAWRWEPRRRQYYLHNFLPEQPDLNLRNPAVQDAILDVGRFWLDRGVDGFRLDVANFYMHDPALRDNPARDDLDAPPYKPYEMQRHLYDRSQPETLDFVARIRALLDSYPDRFSVAEIASHDPIGRMVEYIDGPNRYHTAYSFILLDTAGSASFIRNTLEETRRRGPTAWPSWALSNHDVERAASRWGGREPDPALARILIAMMTCLWGTSFLYQGEELGLPHAEVPFERLCDPEAREFWPALKGRDGARTPMPWSSSATYGGFSTADPWLPVDPRHIRRAVDVQDSDPGSVLTFTRAFLAWRHGESRLKSGDIAFVDTPEPVLAFRRFSPDGPPLVCVFNLGLEPVTVDLGQAGPLRTLDMVPGNNGVINDAGTIALDGYAMMIAEEQA